MTRSRGVLITAAAWFLAVAQVAAGQTSPPVPSKTLPAAKPAAHAFVSPRTGRSYATRVEAKGEDDENDDEADVRTSDVARAPAPSEAHRVPGEFYYNGLPKGARRAAKLSIGTGPVEVVGDLLDLIPTLPPASTMVTHPPRITAATDCGRVAEEQRNVRLTAWLYAMSRESDNDFHLIVGRDPSLGPRRFMTAEVSGLPPADSEPFPRLKAARDALNAYFSAGLPGTDYVFYDPPIPVVVEGSLFFDVSHAAGTPPGPGSLRPSMPTVWEVHPVTGITFEP